MKSIKSPILEGTYIIFAFAWKIIRQLIDHLTYLPSKYLYMIYIQKCTFSFTIQV